MVGHFNQTVGSLTFFLADSFLPDLFLGLHAIRSSQNTFTVLLSVEPLARELLTCVVVDSARSMLFAGLIGALIFIPILVQVGSIPLLTAVDIGSFVPVPVSIKILPLAILGSLHVLAFIPLAIWKKVLTMSMLNAIKVVSLIPLTIIVEVLPKASLFVVNILCLQAFFIFILIDRIST